MSNSVKVRMPQKNGENWNLFAVPISNPPKEMSRSQYHDLLAEHLQHLVDADLPEAQRVMEAGIEYLPNLYEIQATNQPHNWGIQMALCDQMQMKLDQLPWPNQGESQSLPKNEMPTLREIAESL